MLTEGVPPETIAVIDDSGGTLTAPILEGFKAVICKGGTIRSHLGILTREFRIPCLMAAELNGVHDGDRVQVEYTAQPVTPYVDDPSVNVRARIWKLNGEGS
jgi:phosphoenolpyruvate-protein kinase (PTS system EI component)